jgi:outer membrane protein OmpA-like peptidoglycan-associated protein
MLTRFLGVVALSAVPALALAQNAPDYTASEIEAFFAPAVECPAGETCVPKGRTRAVCIGTSSACAADAQARPDPGAFDMLITFDLGSDRLSQQAKENLAEFAKALSSDKLGETSFNIDGHTDARGSDGYNMDLSNRRAEAVVSYLESLGIPRSRLVAKGHGESQPRVDDPFADINRRVEATLPIQ